MTTLTEIETVVDRLPVAQQVELLRHLETNLRCGASEAKRISANEWMRQLDDLRTSIGSGKVSLPGEQILAEMRED